MVEPVFRVRVWLLRDYVQTGEFLETLIFRVSTGNFSWGGGYTLLPCRPVDVSQ